MNGMFRGRIVEQNRLEGAAFDSIRDHERWCFGNAEPCDSPLQYGFAIIRLKAPFGAESLRKIAELKKVRGNASATIRTQPVARSVRTAAAFVIRKFVQLCSGR